MNRFARTLLAVGLCLAASPSRAQDEAKDAVLTPEQFTSALLERLSTHNYFSKIGFVQERSYAPLVMLIQKPSLETPDYAKKIADAHGPWLRKLDELFRVQYVEPLKLVRRKDTPVQAVAVLQTRGDYFNYGQVIDFPRIGVSYANFEPRARLLVTYHDGVAPQGLSSNHFELVEYVRGLLHAYYSGTRNEVAQSWISEGLSSYLAYHTGNQPASLDQRALDTPALGRLVKTSQNAALRSYLIPIASIVELGNANEWGIAIEARVTAAGAAELDGDVFLPTYRAQCCLWMHFLHEGEQGKYRAQLMTYLASALRGSGGLDAFRGAFKGVDLDALDRAFYAWVYASYAAANPQKPLDNSVLDSLFTAPVAAAPAATEPKPAPGAKVAPAAKKGPAPFDPRSVAVSADDLDAAHGLALQRIRGGDLEGALKQLEELDARGRGKPIEERLARELARLRAFIALRDAYFAELVASPDKHTFERDGKKILAKVAKVEDGQVLLGENRAKIERLAVASFTPLEIARDCPKKLSDTPDGWIRNYAFVLEADERWKRGLVGDAKPVAELRADAVGWYPAALRFGAVAQALAQLADAGAPADAAAGRACIERIRAVLATWGQLQVVIDHRAPLAQLAGIALGRTFEPRLLGETFPGKFEDAGDGRLRITVDFSSPAQMGLFKSDPGALRDHRKALDALHPGTASQCEIADGRLRVCGDVGLRCLVPFDAPVSVRAKIRLADCERPASTAIMLCACYDGANSIVGCTRLAAVLVYDQATDEYRTGWEQAVTFVDTDYTIELRLADKRATGSIDGDVRNAVDCKGRTGGEVLLFAHTDAVGSLDDLVIEGKVREESARTAWIEVKLAALGLGAQ